MQKSCNLKCHTITNFPKPFSPDKTPYNKTDFASSVKVSCLSVSSVLSGLRMCKVIVLGDVNVGKTSIVNRFCRQIFSLNYKATIGVDFEVEQFDILKVPFNMQIWDTAGQERFRCIAAAYYRSAHVIVTVFDLTSIKSLHHCIVWMNEALSSNIKTPLKFLVGTKMDLVSNDTYVQVENEATKVAKLMDSEYWAVSARTGEGVTELFYRIAALSFEQIMKAELEAPESRHRIKLGQSLLADWVNAFCGKMSLDNTVCTLVNFPIDGFYTSRYNKTHFENELNKTLRNDGLYTTVKTIMEVEADTGAEVFKEEPMFGVLDIILLLALVGVGAWWLLKDKKKPELSNTKSYAMTLAPLPQQSDNSFIQKLKTSGRSLVAFYGSQTGTGEEFAGRLAKEGIRYKLKGMVADPEECDMEELVNLKDIHNSLAVFCLATYGEGDPTDNAMEFYEWLHSDVDLTGLNYAVFGLGNKTYEHYNEVAIYVDKRLEELGATRVFELGLGDDDANIEDDFITWKDKFWPAVCEYFGIEDAGEDVSVRQYRLTEHTDVSPDRIFTGEVARLQSFKNQRPPYDAKNPFLSKIKVNRELHTGGSRSCMHIEFDIDGSKMRYDSGDHLAVYPVNSDELVEKLGKLLNHDLDRVFTLTNTDEESSKKHPFPCPCSYRTALKHYLDITSNPRTHILKELSEYATDPKEKEMLKQMASTTPDGKALYQKWIIEDNRNVIHILEDMPSCKPAIDHLCELLPRLQCRYYSISSSPKLHPNTVHVTVVLVEYKTPTGRTNKGVATSWLKTLLPSDSFCPAAPIFIRKSQFRLPTRVQTPIIMIGPGTGLAPFRAFIQERHLAREEGKPVGDTILYFGCRKKSEDFLYQSELEQYVAAGTLKLHVAFSRDQAEKVYVTHLLSNNADELWNVIGENNGHLYICGDARTMARDVNDIVRKVLVEKGNMTEQQAQAYLKKMEAQKRFSSDVWS